MAADVSAAKQTSEWPKLNKYKERWSTIIRLVLINNDGKADLWQRHFAINPS